MKKIISILLSVILLLSFAACSNSTNNNGSTESTQNQTVSESNEQTGKILITYFSRAGENYGVGTIEKGNTEIVAEMIAEKYENADLFKIETNYAYPESYDETTKVAKSERDSNARPELKNTVDNFENYDTIFIGYPIWYADMPMAVYTFLESYDFSDKTVIPFCTHAGSGLASTVDSIKNELPSANVMQGLAILGTEIQNNQSQVKNDLNGWLSNLEIK